MGGLNGQGSRRAPSVGTGSKLRDVQGARSQDAPPQPRSAQAPVASSGQPSGYGDGLLWAMAEEFERQAYDNRVSLSGKGVPYIYRALAQSVDRAEIRALRCTDGDSRPVSVPEFGVRLVRFFWNHAPWDRDGDLISQFADPIMFEDCRDALLQRWEGRRVHLALEGRRKNSVPSPMRRTIFKTPVGYKDRNIGG